MQQPHQQQYMVGLTGQHLQNMPHNMHQPFEQARMQQWVNDGNATILQPINGNDNEKLIENEAPIDGYIAPPAYS